MSIFLNEQEAQWWKANKGSDPAASLRWSMLQRADERATRPGLMDEHATVDWWHLIVEYLAEAAMAYRLQPSEQVGRWVVGVVNDVVRRDESDWVGPWFRDHSLKPSSGWLETAHVCVAVAAAIDLAGGAFTEAELTEARQVLGERGVPLCTRWLDQDMYFNQRCILGAGLAAAAVAAEEAAGIERATREFQLCTDMFQPDGSYGESSQYASYAAWGMMVMYESLVRHDEALAEQLSIDRYARCVRWWAANLMYLKPMSGWGAAPRARMVNFNDSGAIAAPDGDVLLHIAARAKSHLPEVAALARWLFDQVHLPLLAQGPFDRASFGFVTRPGFLAPALWANASDVSPQSAEALGMSVMQAYSNGNVIVRDEWAGQTVLAIRGGGEPVHVHSHQHADLNSFILAHRRERMLLDPGHSCYRGQPVRHDRSTIAHNTCTFELPNGTTPPTMTHQEVGQRRRLVDGELEPPVPRGGRRLLAERLNAVSVIGSECADVYGQPIRRFARFWVFVAPRVLFVVDHVVADEPVLVNWHWLLNNRDGQLQMKFVPPDRVVARRGEAGMKLFHASENVSPSCARLMRHTYVHDAYHPKPAQLGEGLSGSGVSLQFRQRDAVAESLTVHAIAVDSFGQVAGWHLRRQDDGVGLESPGAAEHWTLQASAGRMVLREQGSGRAWQIADAGGDTWSLRSE
ncbi:heparinase II/III family protein [Phycisphaerales bacterium AB-hyl4]|uniref:Heparinase II/III family protein n=1 Tax=Natronomicrosphaera hydrolytica TaxID=3242702 RepID=A0ABV4UBQ5_9BACT